jgi:D-beta-D-heptose 7-phosphate kinase/D-beta-D-heptose 1-phosphate adenosyltransferase
MDPTYKALFEKQHTPNIIVVGDVMVDRYLSGVIEKISPEAPVSVFEQKYQSETAGGAANVACGIAAYGANVSIVGVVGADANAELLNSILANQNVHKRHLLTLSDRPTTLKTRIIAQGHQILRIDNEHRTPINEFVCSEIEKIVANLLPDHDLLVLSDYNKGVLSGKLAADLIRMAREKNVPVLVDPKTGPWTNYCGATLIKPNWKEFIQIVGTPIDENDAFVRAEKLRQDLRISALLITHGSEGMILIQEGRQPTVIPAIRQEVYDVTGAGDTALATMAYILQMGANFDQAAEIANIAASLSVRHSGTYLINKQELLAAMSEENYPKKIYPLNALLPIVRGLKQQGKTIVFTNGCFDLIHVGHISLLEKAKSKGDILIVGVNTDQSVKKLKGPERPIVSETERTRVLAALEMVDYVVLFGESDPVNIISILQPDIHIKGGDYSAGQKPMPEKAVVEGYGGKVEFIPIVQGFSTTNTLDKIKKVG